MGIPELQEAAKTRRLAVGILIFDKVEILDFCGPFEALSVCRLDPNADENVTESPFQVSLIAATSATATATATASGGDHPASSISKQDPVTTIGGMQVLPHATIDEYMQKEEGSEQMVGNDDVLNKTTKKRLDILIIPGGYGARQARSNPKVLDFIRYQAQKVSILASVCTGAMVLAESGVLTPGSSITTHWGLIDLLQEWYPNLLVEKSQSVIKQRQQQLQQQKQQETTSPVIFTSAGISAGIDMCFWIIRDIFGEEISRAAAKFMEYSYPEDFSRRIEC